MKVEPTAGVVFLIIIAVAFLISIIGVLNDWFFNGGYL